VVNVVWLVGIGAAIHSSLATPVTAVDLACTQRVDYDH
jgi:hypothetical protein